MADESPARITRVVLKNYNSIVSCDDPGLIARQ
jgi:hypothetical protein